MRRFHTDENIFERTKRRLATVNVGDITDAADFTDGIKAVDIAYDSIFSKMCALDLCACIAGDWLISIMCMQLCEAQ
jgi:hypothetical protein